MAIVHCAQATKKLADLQNEKTSIEEQLDELCSYQNEHPDIPKIGDILKNKTWGGTKQDKPFKVDHVTRVGCRNVAKGLRAIPRWHFFVRASGPLLKADKTEGRLRGQAHIELL